VSIRAWPQVRTLRDPGALRGRLDQLGLDLPVDEVVAAAPDGPLASSFDVVLAPGRTQRVGNRFSVLPMEGWDATGDGRPTELVHRRWQRFGESGAKLVWGGEAVAVRPDGRANPNQLCVGPSSVDDLAALRTTLVDAHRDAAGATDDLLVGLQLTHSGRWSRPDGMPAPRTAYRHPVLDARVGIDPGPGGDAAVLGDDDLDELLDAYVHAAEVAEAAGFAFVDVKACHGYLLHELLGSWARPGRYGGSALERRARFLLAAVTAVRERCPKLGVGVRLSVFDVVPYVAGDDGIGRPEWSTGSGPGGELPRFGGRAPWSTGDPSADGTSTGGGVDRAVDLHEPCVLVGALQAAGVSMVCITAGSPYLNPHIQRPAYFPPSDGYEPPEDPLVGVARLQHAARAISAADPDMVVVGSGLSYLQDFVGHVAQPLVAGGWMTAAGLGRMVLSYPDLPLDLLAGRPLDRRRVCRTFSDCTTAPRNGLVSGCYPLDDHYRARPERAALAIAKRSSKRSSPAVTGDGAATPEGDPR
jgi:2,4-dienoyl-CoA reductase-like NADH-dependent reductase (Old Yellow Enzyme family)